MNLLDALADAVGEIRQKAWTLKAPPPQKESKEEIGTGVSDVSGRLRLRIEEIINIANDARRSLREFV